MIMMMVVIDYFMALSPSYESAKQIPTRLVISPNMLKPQGGLHYSLSYSRIFEMFEIDDTILYWYLMILPGIS